MLRSPASSSTQKLREKLDGVGSQNTQHLAILDDVKPALSDFIFRDERLGPTKAISNVVLR